MLPPGAGAFLKRAAMQLGGTVLLALAALGTAAVFSYAPGDPSLNAATDNAADNLLGAPGAVLADAALQALGYAAGLPLLALAVWGGLLVAGRPVRRPWLRIAALIASLPLAAVALSWLAAPASWRFAAGLGGAAGDLLASSLLGAAGRLAPGVADTWVCAVAGILAAALLVAALGLSFHEWWSSAVTVGRGARHIGRATRSGSAAVHRELSRIRLSRGTEEAHSVEADDAAAEETAPALRARRDDAPAAAAAKKIVTPRSERPKTSKKVAARNQAPLPLGDTDDFQAPPLELLVDADPKQRRRENADALQQNAAYLSTVLEEFGVKGEIVKVRPGPVVTLYELEPAPGIKTSRVINLADDVARSMSAVSVRIAVVPGRSVIGIELPNQHREMVHLRELLGSEDFEKTKAELPLALGKDIGGSPITVDLARMPHLLIAGTTGSGKSVAMNTMILSLLYNLPPERCKFIMIDPKMLELSVYEGIPHLLTPVVTDPSKAVVALKWVVREMEDRYKAMSQLGVRNIAGYNARLRQAEDKGETLTRRVQTGFDEDGKPVMEDQPLPTDPLPYIVVVVDEMADLMLVAGKDVEAAIQRLAQMARAAGIHLMMATQRPSVDVITGTIKANFPTRVSFQVTSKIDSRTILGEQGAEQLLGMGDMLYMAGGGRISRVHGPFVSDEEVERVVQFLAAQGEPAYIESVTEETDEPPMGFPGSAAGGGSADDALYDQAVAIVARERKASTSFIQRHLQIGYNRAARLIERMEAEGVVSAANRVGRREVLVGEH